MEDSEDNPATKKAKEYQARLNGSEKGSVKLLSEVVDFLKQQAEIDGEVPVPDIPAGHPALQRIGKSIAAAHAALLLDTTEEVLEGLVRSTFVDLPRLRIGGVWYYSPEGLRYILTRRAALAIPTETYH
jgi:hypothetical protein